MFNFYFFFYSGFPHPGMKNSELPHYPSYMEFLKGPDPRRMCGRKTVFLVPTPRVAVTKSWLY